MEAKILLVSIIFFTVVMTLIVTLVSNPYISFVGIFFGVIISTLIYAYFDERKKAKEA